MHNSQTFSANSAQYAKHRPHYPQALFQFLKAQTVHHNYAWDCATGNGQAALACANYFAQVAATDLSAEQIAHSLAHPKIHYSISPAESTPFASGTFDLITVAQAFHWFEAPKFFAEAKRLLKPNGVLAIFGYAGFQVTPEIDAVLNMQLYKGLEPFWAAGNRQLMAGYREVGLPFAEIIPPHNFEMRLEWNLTQLLDYLRTWSAVKRFTTEVGHDPVAKLVDHLQPVWAKPEKPKVVTMPLFFKAGRKN